MALTEMAPDARANDSMPENLSDVMARDGLEVRRMSEWRDGNDSRRERSVEETITLSVTTTAPGELAGLVGSRLIESGILTVDGDNILRCETAFGTEVVTPEGRVMPEGMEVRRMKEDRRKTGMLKEEGEHEPITMTVTTTEPGQLAELIGEALYDIDEITVSGPINDADINTLWQCSFMGYLSVIDLGNASLEGNILPPGAFYHPSQQERPDLGYFYVLWLEKIILPEGLTEIEDGGFYKVFGLKEVVFPQTLRKIDEIAFFGCSSLTADGIKFNDTALEEIGYQAFMCCPNLSGELTFPPTFKRFKGCTFLYAPLTKVTFPPTLESIPYYDFGNSKFEEIDIPNSCELGIYGFQFSTNFNIKRAHIPEGQTVIPESLFAFCKNLEEVNIPDGVVELGRDCFNYTNLKEVTLPEGVEKIGELAFADCYNLECLVLPSTLMEIGDYCFASNHGMQRIYSKALVPPVCGPSAFNNIDNRIPVCIPLGTTDLYWNAPGWNHFKFFIETDDFTDINTVTSEQIESDDNTMYDLSGKPILNPKQGEIYIHNGKKSIKTK